MSVEGRGSSYTDLIMGVEWEMSDMIWQIDEQGAVQWEGSMVQRKVG
jgi:hypothetical protein